MAEQPKEGETPFLSVCDAFIEPPLTIESLPTFRSFGGSHCLRRHGLPVWAAGVAGAESSSFSLLGGFKGNPREWAGFLRPLASLGMINPTAPIAPEIRARQPQPAPCGPGKPPHHDGRHRHSDPKAKAICPPPTQFHGRLLPRSGPKTNRPKRTSIPSR